MLIGYLATQFGVSEAALNLLLGVFLGYPIAYLYRKYIFDKSQQIQCLYFIVTGLAIGFWNFGWGMFHCLFSILLSYCVMTLLNASIISVGVIFVFTLSYLLTGYYYSSTDSYDITWTMPYCILVLRLIGVAFDAYDGIHAKATKNKWALTETPTFLQVFAHSLFPSAFLVGPQFSMGRFLEFLNGKYNSKDSNGKVLPADSMNSALYKLGQGVLYLATYQALTYIVSDDFMLSDNFANMCFFKKLFLMGIWGRYSLYKYISCWLLTEGACIMFGLSYNGEENGKTKWDGVSNIKLKIFEQSTEFNHYIQSFNVNTNEWVATHIYKRLKFLGSKYYSQAGVLLFLAVWHGIHSGYYVTFLHEFIVIYVERDFQKFVKSNDTVSGFFDIPAVKIVSQVLLRLYTFIFMGWSVIPFAFLQYPRYLKVYANCGYSGFMVHYAWIILYAPLLRMIFKRQDTQKQD